MSPGLTSYISSQSSFLRTWVLFLFSLSCLILPTSALASASSGTIDATDRYAWGENIGWVDFGSTTDTVHVTDSGLTGSVYGENIGWVVLNPVGYGGVVNDAEGNLSGEAWGENIGWVDFSQVVIGSDGVFTGQAYGENIGWLTFGTTTNKVTTDWRPYSERPHLVLSGTLYSDEGATPITDVVTITAAIGTSTPSTHSTTTESGSYNIIIPDGHAIAAGTPILVYVNSSTTVKASHFTKASSTTSMANLNLFQNEVIVSHEATTGTSTTMADLAFYDADDDADITYTANSNNLVLTENTGLYIKTGKSLTLGTNATTTAFTNYGTTTAPSGTFTIQGDYTNYGYFDNNNGTVIMSSSSPQQLVGKVATSSSFYNLVIDGVGPKSVADKWNVATDTSDFYIEKMIIDETNSVIYAGSSNDGIIYRCVLSTGCDTLGNFTIAYDTTDSAILALTIDSVNGVLYVGTGYNGILYRCVLSTGCDASGDFAVAYDTPQANIKGLAIDSINSVLYFVSEAMVGSSALYRCVLSTGCDASGDFAVAYSSSEEYMLSIVIDHSNEVLYVGSGYNGIIFRCALSTDCDASGDFTTAYDSAEAYINSLAIDTVNNVLYASTYASGIIYRCALSTDCDASGDFTVAYDTSDNNLFQVFVDNNDSVLYAVGDSGIIYKCVLSTNCDDSGDFLELHHISNRVLKSIAVDSVYRVLYIGSGTIGQIYSCKLDTGCDFSTNNIFVTNFTNATSSTFLNKDQQHLQVSGNYLNGGNVISSSTANIKFTGTSSQILSGTLTGTSALPSVTFTGAGTKTFSNNASTTSNMNISNGSTVVAPSHLTVAGNFIQNGTYTHNSGTLYLSGFGTQASGTLDLNDLSVVFGYGVSEFSTYLFTGGGTIHSSVIDNLNRVLYVANASYIYRCVLSTGCYSAGDFTVAYESLEPEVYSLAIDEANSVLYVGTGYDGILYRCELSTNCDAPGDFVVAYNTPALYARSLIIDEANSVLYLGTGESGIIYRCALSTDCDASGDFTLPYDTPSVRIYAFTIDTTNNVLYIGTGNGGVIYRCALSTDCDASGDFTVAYDTSETYIYSLTIDSVNGVLYAGSGDGGVIYRCALSTDCDASGDFTVAYDTSETEIKSLNIDNVNNILYIGTGNDGNLYSCLLSTGCDVSDDFSVIFSSEDNTISSIVYDQDSAVLYTGTASGYGYINRRAAGPIFNASANINNLVIETSKSLQANSNLAVNGNYNNQGFFIATTTKTVSFSGTSPQTATGTMTGTSAFTNLTITNNTASTTFNAPIEVTNTFSATNPGTIIELASNATSTFNNVTITGTSSDEVILRSTTPGSRFGFYMSGFPNITDVDIKDGQASSSFGLIPVTGIDSGNNVGWSFYLFAITLADGTTLPNTILYPSGVATATNRFTLVASNGTTTPVTSMSVSLLDAYATTGIARIEVTSADGNTIYGSSTNPQNGVTTITLDQNILNATPSPTTYLVRIVPKLHADMPAVPGEEYSARTRVTDVVSAGSFINTGSYGPTVTIDNLSLGTSTSFLVSLYDEDYETGDLGTASTSGDVIWAIATDSVNSGTYSAKSGAITDDQFSHLEFTATVTASGSELTFARRVSSEACCDFLELFIDDVSIESWDGEVAWSTVGPYALADGLRTIRFTYYKDGSVLEGSDTAWIDDISITGLVNLPPTATTSPGVSALISFFTPSESDYNSSLVLYNTATSTNVPAEGVTYTSGQTIGTSTVGCVNTEGVSATSTSCDLTGLTQYQTYNFTLFAKDDAGNYNSGVPLDSFLVTEVSGGDTIEISGILYEEDHSTPYATSSTVKVVIATSTPSVHSTTTIPTTGTFAFSVAIATSVPTSTPVTVFVDGSAVIKAVTITKTSGTSTIPNLDLYKNTVTITHEATTSTSTTMADLAFYDGDDDADITYTANAGNLVLTENTGLYIKTGKSLTLGTNATTTAFTNYGTTTAPSGTFTIQGDYTNYGYFDNNNGTVVMSSSSPQQLIGKVATSSSFNNLVVDGTGEKSVADKFTVATDTSEVSILSLVTDYQNSVLYAGSGNGGIIYRCTLSTGCNETSDFTVAYDTAETQIYSLAIDTTNGVLYAGSGGGGIIYRCLLSTGCDDSGDFTTAYDTAQTLILALIIDAENDVLYAGSGVEGIIYRCLLSTGCDDSGDFTTAYDTTASRIFSFAIDTANDVLYAGSGTGGIIYRCLLSTGCDDSGDFTTAYDATTFRIYSLAIDTESGVLYASSDSEGVIYRCLLSTGCDDSGDFTTAYDTPEAAIWSLTIDTENGVLYAGSGTGGIIYRCTLSTGCDVLGDFEVAYDTPESVIYSLAIHAGSGVLYAGSGAGGIIYRCVLGSGCDTGDSNALYLTNLTTNSGSTLYTPKTTSLSGSFMQSGTTISSSTNNFFFTGVSSQTLSGTLTGTSSLPNVTMSGVGTKTFANTAETTGYLTIETGSTLVAPSTSLTVAGNFTQNGTFTHNSGTLNFAGLGTAATGTLTDTSALGNVASVVGASLDEFTTVDLALASDSIFTLVVDYTNGVLYAGTGSFDGIIYRCALSTGCDEASDFTIAYDSATGSIYSLAIDTTNGTLYASISSGSIYRCSLSTSCDDSGDFTTVSGVGSSRIRTTIIDTTNGVLYGGSDSDGIHRCLLSTGCDAAGDFTSAAVTGTIRALAIDATNGVLYAGSGTNGIIYRCLLSTGCNETGDFTTAYDTSETYIYSLTIDATNGVLYAGSDTNGIIYRCLLSTGCDAAGDFTSAAVTGTIRALAIDATNGVLYAGATVIYRCLLSTNCDDTGDFTIAYNEAGATSLAIDTTNGTLYAGYSDMNRRAGGPIFGANASTTNFTIAAGKSITVPAELSIAGNYTNHGAFITATTSTTTFDGTSAQTITGNATGTSAFANTVYRGAGTKTFASTSAAANNFIVEGTSGEVILPEELSLTGDYVNNSTTTHGGAKWTLQTSTTTNQWQSVTYGNGLFVAVADSGTGNRVMTSPDGINWTSRNSAADNWWTSVTYGNGLFVAVSQTGAGNRVMTSPDGVTWTSRTSAVDNNWRSVTYGNGLFVSVASTGSGDRVMKSYDGINWSTSTSAADNVWLSVTYGNGLFVAVGCGPVCNTSGGNRVMTSPDGVVWTSRISASETKFWSSVTYGNGLFVSVATGGQVMTSPDGITWTIRISAVYDAWQSVTYGNGLFVAAAASCSDCLMTSPDGITWTARIPAAYQAWRSITYGNGLFVAVADSGFYGADKRVMTSTLSTLTLESANPQGLSGTLSGASTLGNLHFTGTGTKTFNANASTSDFVINTGATAVAPASLAISGNYMNNGTLTTTGNTTYLTGSTPQSLSGTSTFNNLYLKNYSRTGTTTFNSALTVGDTFTADGSTYIGLLSGATSTIANLTLNGSSTAPISFGSTATGTKSNLIVSGSTVVTYTRVQDSSACGSNGGVIDVSTGNNTDGGNTECWNFTAPASASVSLESNLQFYVGQATTTFGTVTVTDAETPSITSASDIRLTIATTTTNFRFDTTNTTPTFGGTASGKVNSTVSYIDGGATLLIDVTTNFSATDTLAISGLSVGSFTSVSSSTSQLALHTDGDSVGTPTDLSNETIKLTGALTSSDHDAGQPTNQFSFQNRTAVPLFNFKLTPTGESATITDTVITLSGIDNLDTSDITNFKLYRDNNSDGAIDGGDTLLDASGILTMNGQHGAITFSTDFLATTTTNFIVIGDTNTIPMGGAVVFSVNTTSFTTIGLTSGFALYPINTTSNIQHLRNGGAGGGNSQIGGAPPSGASLETGGGSGTGGETGQGTDGANIAPDPDFQKPTGLGSDNDWTNPTNAYASDGLYATASSTNFRQSYINFGFNVPGGNTIQGLAVKLDASGSTAAGTIDVAISWDGGNSYTTAKATPTLSGTDIVYTVGGGTDTWGRSWTPGEFDNSLFRLRVTAQPSTNTLRLDALEVRVYHQAGGGGAGGGGGI